MMYLKTFFLVTLLFVSLSLMNGCQTFSSTLEETVEVTGNIYPPFNVDSEYGMFNGMFSPKIVYYTTILDTDKANLNEATLLIKDNTLIYLHSDGETRKVSLEMLRNATRIQASVYKTDYQSVRPTVAASKVVILTLRDKPLTR